MLTIRAFDARSKVKTLVLKQATFWTSTAFFWHFGGSVLSTSPTSLSRGDVGVTLVLSSIPLAAPRLPSAAADRRIQTPTSALLLNNAFAIRDGRRSVGDGSTTTGDTPADDPFARSDRAV